jgi:hypothetical protein
MGMQELLSVPALVISAGAFTLSLAATVAQRRRANMEIASNLHIDLTSGLVEGARRPLGEIAFGVLEAWKEDPDRRDFGAIVSNHEARPEDIRHQYFVLLWCFERVWHGYRVIRDDRILGNRAAEDFAQMIAWHVRTWAWSLPAVKSALEPHLGKFHDGDSVKALAELTDSVLKPDDHAFLIQRLRGMGLDPIGNPEWGRSLRHAPT